MPDCQSGAVHSLVCGTIIYSAVAGDIGVCHGGNAAKPCVIKAAAVFEVPISFQRKRRARVGARFGQADRLL